MILSQEQWMELRAFKALAEAGATWAEIARETGHDWRTVKRYLSAEAPTSPPAPARRGPGPRKIDPYAGLVDAWLRAQPRLRASVIHERLVAQHGFDGHYQRVKIYVREARARLDQVDPVPAGFHRRFEVLPGAQAQVDWGDEGEILTAGGPLRVSSFHMTLSYSRDPFCCFVAAQDLATFWDCHRRAFAHFGGVPAVIVYDRTKTVVRRHVVRSHVLDGRAFDSLAAMDAAVADWLPSRRAATHRTHGEVIAVRAERDRAALRPLPERPYLVVERHTRRVGKDALVSFGASHYSVPWRQVRPGGRVELRVTPAEVTVWSLGRQPQMLATHARAIGRGAWVVDQAHWDGLPNRADAQPLPPCAADCELTPPPEPEPGQLELLGISGSAQAAVAHTRVARRRLAVYDELVGVAP